MSWGWGGGRGAACECHPLSVLDVILLAVYFLLFLLLFFFFLSFFFLLFFLFRAFCSTAGDLVSSLTQSPRVGSLNGAAAGKVLISCVTQALIFILIS